ncbi:chromosomal replication initiator protein DnaA [Campylobacter sp. 19-13652]|nr:chromosomal replication initiator protein DnaA [Campylobacter sp. 19-13652]
MIDYDALASDLRAKIPQNEYDSYIAQLSIDKKQSSKEHITFNAPNEIIARFVQTRYADKISAIAEIKTGVRAAISIQVAGKTPKQNSPVKPTSSVPSSPLNPAYTFDSFVIGDSNQFAYGICEQASKNPGKVYNPIFIYGPTGLGKTHLLQAFGNECLKQQKTVIYVTSEQFINDYVSHLKNNSMNKFQEKYRNCDALLIDDVQFLGKTERIQEEFFHTFNALHTKQAQILMTSDRPPKTLKGFEERLVSRFEWGMTPDITPPDLETKIVIIQKKCEFNNITLSKDVIEYIAVNMGDNIREIEGAITEIAAFSRMIGQSITLDFAKNIIKNRIKERLENVSLDDIIAVVSRELNIKPSEIKSKSRAQNIAKARSIVIYLAKTLTPNSMPQIASYFSMKDHSAVSKNIKKTTENMQNDDEFRLLVDEIHAKIVSK